MADKEIKIKVSTETDVSQLEELDALIESIQEKSGVKVDVDDSSIDAAAGKTEGLNSGLDETNGKTASPDIEDSGIDNAVEKTRGLNSDLDETNGKTVSLNSDTSEIELLTKSIAEAEAEAEKLENVLAEAELNGDDIQADIIADELYYTRQEVENLKSSLDELTSNSISLDIDNGDIDDAIDITEQLNDELDNIDGKSVSVDVDDGSIDDAIDMTEELDDDLDGIDSKTASPDVDDSGIEDADEKAKELNDDLDELDGKTVSPDVDSSDIDEFKEKTEEASSSMDSLATAAAGIGVTAGVEQMVSTADRINTSWNQLELTFGSVSEKMKSDISNTANATGRSGGEIRGYFNQMGIAGVTNSDLLSSSFEALAGKAYQTGNSIESMETKMQTMVLTGNASSKMLKSLGLSAEDLANAMGVSADQVNEAFKNMTPEERLQAITQAMGDGAEANEMYKNSYEGLKTQASTAMAGLMGAVGQAILPVVIPALQAATNFVKFLTDGFKMLPAPVQGVIGGLLGFAGIALTVVGMLGTMGQMFKMVKGGLEALNLVTKLSAIYNKAAAAAQWLLNIAMDANPVMLVVIAIIALIAVLGYLYFNNEQVRQAIDSLGQTLQWLGGVILDSVMGTIQWLSEQFQNFTDQLGLNSNDWVQAILGFILFLPQLPMYLGQVLLDAIAKALGFGDNFTQNMITSATMGVNGFISAIVGFPAWLWSILVNAYNRVIQFGVNFVNGLVNKALSAVNGFSNAVQGIPRALQSCLDWAYNLVMSHPLVQALVWLGQQAANAFAVIGLGQRSPGKIVKALKQELNWASEAVRDSDLANDTAGLGSRLSDSFNPDLGGRGGFGNGSSGTGGGDLIVNIYGDVDNEERARFIIETFRKEISWNNQTAGRTN